MISFIVPVYNEEKLLADCIASIRQEAQGIDYEIIVADNGSTDRSVEIAEFLMCKVVHVPEKGVTRARQAAFEASKYDLCAFIDADCMLPPGWLVAALFALDEEGVVAASGPYVYYDMRLSKRMVRFILCVCAKPLHYMTPILFGGNAIARKEALIKIGGFNTKIEFFGEDIDTAVRLSKVGKVNYHLGMCVLSSARRMNVEGMFRTEFRYALNYLWVQVMGHPYTEKYKDIRP